MKKKKRKNLFVLAKKENVEERRALTRNDVDQALVLDIREDA